MAEIVEGKAIEFPRQVSAVFSKDGNGKERTWLYFIDVEDDGKLKYFESNEDFPEEERRGPPYQPSSIIDTNNNFVKGDSKSPALSATTFTNGSYQIETRIYFRSQEGRLREIAYGPRSKGGRWYEGELSKEQEPLQKAEISATTASNQLKVFYTPEGSSAPNVYWYGLASGGQWTSRKILSN